MKNRKVFYIDINNMSNSDLELHITAIKKKYMGCDIIPEESKPSLDEDKPYPEPPTPPLCRTILEDLGYFTGFDTYCDKCGSTIKKTWSGFGKVLGCIHPECVDYYKK